MKRGDPWFWWDARTGMPIRFNPAATPTQDRLRENERKRKKIREDLDNLRRDYDVAGESWLDFFFNRLGMQLAQKEFVDVDLYMTEVQFEGFSFEKGFCLLMTTRFYKAHLPSYERIRLLLVEMIEKEPVDERSKRIARMALEGMR